MVRGEDSGGVDFYMIATCINTKSTSISTPLLISLQGKLVVVLVLGCNFPHTPALQLISLAGKLFVVQALVSLKNFPPL